jgi:hypothetical protein
VIFASVSTHGATGTWLDEILELGIPLILFIGLWWWSTRKSRGAKPPGPRSQTTDSTGGRGAEPPA